MVQRRQTMCMTSTNKPLDQKRILVTRAVDQSGQLENMLREQGAEPISVPLIEFRQIAAPVETQKILESLNEFNWILFTSGNAIRYFFELLGDRLIPSTTQLACVGSRTATTLREFDYEPNFVPSQFSSQRLAEEINVEAGQKILYPSPREISSDLVSSLESIGASVTRWQIYETLQVNVRPADLETLRSGLDAVTFASPSVVSSYCEQVPEYKTLLEQTVTACIGPMTRRRASELGIRVDVLPRRIYGVRYG